MSEDEAKALPVTFLKLGVVSTSLGALIIRVIRVLMWSCTALLADGGAGGGLEVLAGAWSMLCPTKWTVM